MQIMKWKVVCKCLYKKMIIERNYFVHSKIRSKNSREQCDRLFISLCANTALSSSFSNFLDPKLPTPSDFNEAVCVWFGTNLDHISSQRIHSQSPDVCFCFLFNQKATCFRLRAASLFSAKFPHRTAIFIIWINTRISREQMPLIRIYIAMTSRWFSNPRPSSSPWSLVVISKFSLWSGCVKQADRTIIRTQIRSIHAADDESKKKTAIVTDTVISIYDLTSRAFGSSWSATTIPRSTPRSILRLNNIFFAWQSI